MLTLFQKIRSVLDKPLLKNLVGFLTGSQFLIVSEINVDLVNNVNVYLVYCDTRVLKDGMTPQPFSIYFIYLTSFLVRILL